MPSQYPIDEVFVRPDRQRKDLGNITELSESLARLGQINPIIIERNGDLIAGERRLRAAQAIGWTHIEVKIWEDLDDFARQAIELEENVKRKQLDWKELVDAVARYHDLRKSTDAKWTQDATADALGLGRATVTDYLRVDSELKRGNQRVAEATKLSVATGLALRANARRAEAEIDAIAEAHPTAPETAKSNTCPHAIITADFTEWAATYTGPKFNFIHCDFPYGINAQDIQQGVAVETHGGYDDTPEIYWQLLLTLGRHIDTIVTENAHMLFWLSWKNFEETKTYLRGMGWKVLDYPIIWHKTDNAGLLPDPKRGPRYVSEVALFCSRGDRFIVQAVANTFGHATENDVHMSIKPEAMLKHFFRMFIDDSSRMLDPTCGSGSSIRAAASLGANFALGLELNETFADLARAKLEETWSEAHAK